MKRLDLMSPRKFIAKNTGEEKTTWKNYGSIIIKDDGKVTVFLEGYPLPNEKGEVVLQGFEPRAKEQSQSQSYNTELNDEIPF